jgi:soluble lytic murein transglycosylase-like protein
VTVAGVGARSYGLENKTTSPADDGLEKWLAQFASMKEETPLTFKEFSKKHLELEEVSKLLLFIRYSEKGLIKDIDPEDAIDIGLAQLNRLLVSSAAQSHILFPYLISELRNSKYIDDAMKVWLLEQLRKYGQNSLLKKEMVRLDIEEASKAGLSAEQISRFIQSITSFKSLSFRRENLRRLIRVIPPELQAQFALELKPIVKPFTEFADEFPWLLWDDASLGAAPLAKALSKARLEAGLDHCQVAESHVLAILLVFKSIDASMIEPTLVKLDECYRGKKISSLRTTFWQRIRKPLQDALGFSGEEIALRRLALIYWGMDDFERAIKILSELHAEAQRLKKEDIEAQALYTLGKVVENQNDIKSAINHYREYVTRFYKREQFEDAMMSLVVLLVAERRDKEALSFINHTLKRISQTGNNEFESSGLSFALYWGGRISLKLGDVDTAKKMWKKLSEECYSTFYGALGHYSLEKLENQSIALMPAKTSVFKWDDIYSKLDKHDQQVVSRAAALLRIGMKDAVLNELTELSGDSANYYRTLVDAMFRYAMNDWLPAVIKYSEIPHSFRHNLPPSLEKILFPRVFADLIQMYAGRLGVDPDFILAIIRQESVFNPKAESPVGASGLMQLMPATAKREMKKMSSGYLTDEEKREISRLLSHAAQIFEVKPNLMLGVHHVYSLLDQYQNPVFMLSAYNANPRAASRWIKKLGTEDMMVFIERIPYKETRSYVKLVMRNYFYYKRWYPESKTSMNYLDQIVQDLKMATGMKTSQSLLISPQGNGS